MGKSTGFRFAGDGPGFQKKSKLAKKYLQGKGVSKRGSMKDLDFGVEVVQKPSKDMQETGLNGLRDLKSDAVQKVLAVSKKDSVIKKAVPAAKEKKEGKKGGKAEEEGVEEAGKKAEGGQRKVGAGAVWEGKKLTLEGEVYAPMVGVGMRLAEKVGASLLSSQKGDMSAEQWARQEALKKTEEKKKKKCAPC